MTVTLELAPELESALRDEAARQGVDTSTFIITALEDVAQRMGRIPRRPMTEAEFLREIGRGLSAEMVVASEKLAKDLPKDVGTAVVCQSPDELGALLSPGFSEWNAVRNEIANGTRRIRKIQKQKRPKK